MRVVNDQKSVVVNDQILVVSYRIWWREREGESESERGKKAEARKQRKTKANKTKEEKDNVETNRRRES